MIVTCEQCSRRFHLDDNRISASGSKVRCSKCKHVFKVYPKVDQIVPEPIEPRVTSAPPQLEPSVTDTFEFDAVRLEEIPLPPPQESRIQPSDDLVGIVVSPSEASTLEPSSLSMDTDLPEPPPSTLPEGDRKPISLEDIDLSLQALQKEVSASTDADSSIQKSSEDIDLDLEFLTLEKDTGKEQTADASAAPMSLDEMSLDDLDSMVPAPPPKEEELQADRMEALEVEPSSFVEEIFVEDIPATSAAIEQVPSASLDQDQSVSKKTAGDFVSFDDIEALDLDEIEKLIEKNQMGLIGGEGSEETALSHKRDAESARPPDTKSLGDQPTDIVGKDMSHRQDAFTETAILDPSTLSIGSQSSKEGEPEDQEMPELPSKKPVSKMLIAVLCLVVLVGGGYLAMTFFPDIPIPFLASQPQEPEDVAGNRKIRIYDVNSKFMDTAGAGRLFVITGKIRNDYPEAHGFVSVKGKLYDAAKKEVQSQTVFCGNVLSNEELNTMQVEAIQKALSQRLGKDRVNARIEPGGSIPFMMVFSQLSDQLDEFSLEVIGSAKIS